MGMMMNEDLVLNYYVNQITLEERNKFDTETFYTQAFALATSALQKRYSDYLLRVIPSKDTVYKSLDELDNIALLKLKEFLDCFSKCKEVTPLNLGQVKYYYDSFFYSLTNSGYLDYLYDKEYLLTVEEAGDKLEVTRPTINKYSKNGQLEMINTTKHKKIPLHAVEMWKDTGLLTKVHMLSEAFKSRNNHLHEQYEEILKRIKEFEEEYDNQPFEIVFKDVLNGKIHWDEVDSVSDYAEWEALIEDLNEIKGKLGIN
ncbi:hypothetical protein JCM9140_2781 [Halalkalibacter wakoensis JCM 9140]|uniref:Helix-turn-helix domain-containing protein n=1 Tax=Halalkalibacter wakoensis JCM 9140 TaxID=1236970 RepID=W4Q5Q0_9BACI|nr:helix-turn-helix domain-containing protein [Halalkalibacter wakoensis]GAE26694.1 hypothetical protein JCM9140_2781 [Halalkalibacter wakoensis JCM 9140]